MAYSPVLDFHNIKAEKLKTIAEPLELSIPMDGELWLRRNVKAAEAAMFLPTHIVSAWQAPGLPGYIDFSGIKTVKSPAYAGMPVKSMRDLTELILFDQAGTTWAWLSGADYMPAGLAPALDTGVNTLAIGSEGQNQWLTVDFAATLSFEIPPKGRAIVFGEAEIAYDSVIDNGDISVPAGSLLEIAGEPGDLFRIIAAAENPPVAVVSISLNKAQTSLRVGDCETLTAAVKPADAVGADNLTWKSSDEGVAVVDGSGKVQALAPGTARITVEAGGIGPAACIVTVVSGSSSGGGRNKGKTIPPVTPGPAVPEPVIPGAAAPGATMFADLAGYSWAGEAITVLAGKGVIKGVSGTSFAPANQINRADYLLLIVRLLGLTADVDSNFDDVGENKYYYREIGIARALGLTSGVDGANFQPEAGVTRQDMFVLAFRILRQQGLINTGGDPGVLDRFADRAEVSPYAGEALATLVSMDLVKGSENMLNPLGNVTRAEAAVFVHNLSKLF
ncbi:MAG: Endo-1,4-beta-xylanase A precursor [Firmicutes bacterium ADurb.Bin373]|nr:MAG: Endo-1,4-beta-xylanase A precursor [Firmicutes bacterium ADurb.Bin373]